MRRLLAAAVIACVPVLGLLAAQGASASASPGYAVSHLTARPDSGNNGNWALDNIWRYLSVSGGTPVASSDCAGSPAHCYAFTAIISDSGTFATIGGAYTPNQVNAGQKIRGRVSGDMEGAAAYAFDASAQPDMALVPASVSGAADDTASWYTLAFPAGTTFDPGTSADADINPWSWSYHADCITYRTVTRHHRRRREIRVTREQWVDAATNGDGNLAGDGNITGCAAR